MEGSSTTEYLVGCTCYNCMECLDREGGYLHTPVRQDTMMGSFVWTDAALELEAVKSMFTPFRERYRNCLFLADHPTGVIPFDPKYMVYLIYVERSCDGIHCFQGYVEFTDATVTNTVRRLLGGDGVMLIRRTTHTQAWTQSEAIAFIKGDHTGTVGGPYEYGCPRTQGNRHIL